MSTNPITKVVFTPLPQYDIIKEWEHPDFNARYGIERKVRKEDSRMVNHVLDCFPEGYRRLVDIKVQPLELEHTTCQPGWHCDTTMDPDAVHHLFVLGENRTEFLIDGEAVRIPEGHFASYGSTVQHRGPVVTVPETRVLIRTTESAMVAGNSIFEDEYKFRYPIGGEHVRI